MKPKTAAPPPPLAPSLSTMMLLDLVFISADSVCVCFVDLGEWGKMTKSSKVHMMMMVASSLSCDLVYIRRSRKRAAGDG